VRVVNAAPHPGGGLVTAIDKNRELADYAVLLLDDSGHFPMLEQPARFLPLFERWIAELSAPTVER
jgi:pimeloyl-ACP methyl ester carboxylesterase